ncbi:MAG: SCP2 sterol-binding domain-containing protein [Proteobacteria bacterium]|nr:SCP2 sterol-binding domain-containing protein [Pseudomonadota bacterium]MDA1060077.1 SCP2 sterol-binding domain-containing protein [Pseudomonadota bacterium]
MDLEQMTEALRAKAGDAAGLDATIKFDFGDDGIIFLDGEATPNTVSNEDREADCTITLTFENFKKLVDGDLNPTTAFMMGKLKIDGSMSIAMKLQGLLG